MYNSYCWIEKFLQLHIVNFITSRFGERGKKLYRSWWCHPGLAKRSSNEVLPLKMFPSLLALLYILKIRLGSNLNIVNFITSRYGEERKKLYRSWWCQPGLAKRSSNQVLPLKLFPSLLALLYILKIRLGSNSNIVNFITSRYVEEGNKLYRSSWCQPLLVKRSSNQVLPLKMFPSLLALLFILKKRLGSNSNIVNFITSRYGEEGKKLYRSWWCQPGLAKRSSNEVLSLKRFPSLLALLFILKKRLGSNSNIVNFITSRYGEEGKKLYRSWWCQPGLAKRSSNEVLPLKMFPSLLALLFILKIRLGANSNIVNFTTSRNVEEGKKIYRSWWCQPGLPKRSSNQVLPLKMFPSLLALLFIPI